MSVFIDQPFTTRAMVGTFHAISFCPAAGAASSAFLTTGSTLLYIEALARFDADPLHPRDNWLISDVRRMQLQKLGRVGEIICRPVMVST